MKKKILVIASGSVAVKKTLDLVNSLNDYEVKVIATDYAKHNYFADSDFAFETEEPNLKTVNIPKHIFLAKWADLICVVPASANTIAKFVSGHCDNFALTTMMAHNKPIMFVPAMNNVMWDNLVKMQLIEKLLNLDHIILGPMVGKLCNGDLMIGRMVEPSEIKIAIDSLLSNKNKKAKILVASGASKVFIDPLRYITNMSSGKTGRLLSNELRLKGFDVKFVEINNLTNEEFANLALQIDYDYYISPAAFADFNVIKSETKIKKGTINQIELQDNLDVLTFLKERKPNAKYIAFKHDENEANAITKLNKLNLDAIVWNTIGSMGKDSISGKIFFKDKSEVPFDCSKQELAKKIAEVI